MQIRHNALLIVIVALAAFTLGGCVDARTQLGIANDAKKAIDTEIELMVDAGRFNGKPEQAEAILLATQSVDAALDLAESYLDADGSASPGFYDVLDGIEATLAWLERELEKADKETP